ncbi:MAG TPA: type II secretion system protein [Stellaceae bacterium]|jgi:general secretion pathway protein I
MSAERAPGEAGFTLLRAPADAGFTLLEVVVALAIASLALVALFQAGSGGLFAVDTAARAEEALQRAQSHLAAVGRNAALIDGDASGDDGGGYRWRLRIQPVMQRQGLAADGVTAQTTTLFDVEVAISWRQQGHTRAVVLRTLRLGTGGAPG